MINIKNRFEKEVVMHGKNEVLFLTQLSGTKSNKVSKRAKVNLGLAIDISTSMSQSLEGSNFGGGLGAFLNIRGEQANPSHKSKIDLAKEAAVKCVEMLEKGDFISITLFDNKVETLQNPIKISENNKFAIIEKIKSIAVRGSTDVHSGWLTAATHVAQNLNNKYINRVLLISDGETNAGVQDPKLIAADVEKLYNQSITTSCFGVGKGFNEDLLQSMANYGNGNFYYIEKSENFVENFESEFNGLSNLIASDVKIEIKLNDGKIIEQYNNFIKNDNEYLVTNIYANRINSILFKIKLSIPKDVKVADIGSFLLKYKDENGTIITHEEKITIKVVSKSKWEKEDFDKEVKVQETLLVIANNKIEMTKALDLGDKDRLNSLIQGSIMYAASSGINDSRLAGETQALKDTFTKTTTLSSNELRKDISNQSYITRNNK